MAMLITLLIIALTEAVLHWFPWRMALGGKSLPRIPAYIMGVLAFVLPLIVYDLTNGMLKPAVQLTEAVIVAGISVVLAYTIDWALETYWRAENAEQISAHFAKEIKRMWRESDGEG